MTRNACLVIVMLLSGLPLLLAADTPPKVGGAAPDFELASVTGAKVKLSEVASQSPVVLIVLRGFPGYQCPLCNRQVGQYLKQAEKLKAAGQCCPGGKCGPGGCCSPGQCEPKR